MTVSSTLRKAGPFNGNGVTTAFPFAFKVFAKTDIEVVKTDAAGAQTTLVLDSDYSVALNADQDNSPGGTITYPLSGSALANGESLVGVGSLTYDQGTDITNLGRFLPQVHENVFDRVVMLIQQLLEKFTRVVTAPVGDTATSLTLPTASARANKALVFDAGGNVGVSADTAAEAAAAAASAATAQAAATQAQTAIPPVQVVDYTALRAYAGTATTLYVTGYMVTAAPAGVVGTFTRDDSDTTSADNGGTIIVASNGKRWKRTYSGAVNVLWFGAKGDGVTDDSAASQAAVSASRSVYFPRRNYLWASTVTAASTCHLFGEVSSYGDTASSSILTYTGTGAALSITGAGKIYNPAIENLVISASGGAASSATAIGLLLTSCNYGAFKNVVVKGFAAGTGVKATATVGNIGATNTFTGCFLWGNKVGYSFGGVAVDSADYASVVLGGAVIGTGAAGSVGVTVDQYAAETLFFGTDVETCDVCFDLYGNGTTSGGGVKLIGTRSEFQTTAGVRVNAGTNATQLIGHRFVGGSAATWLIDNGTRTFRTDIDASVRLNTASLEILNNIPITMEDSGGTARSVLRFATNDTLQIGSSDYSGFNGNYPLGTWHFSFPATDPDYTAATLPAAASHTNGRAFVSDSPVTAAGNFGADATGGGTLRVPVYSDGVSWKIG